MNFIVMVNAVVVVLVPMAYNGTSSVIVFKLVAFFMFLYTN